MSAALFGRGPQKYTLSAALFGRGPQKYVCLPHFFAAFFWRVLEI
jgi:hypothetical protein